MESMTDWAFSWPISGGARRVSKGCWSGVLGDGEDSGEGSGGFGWGDRGQDLRW